MNKFTNITAPTALPDLCGEIVGIIQSSLAPKAMEERLRAYHEKDLALTLPLLTREECCRLFRVLPTETLAAVLSADEDGASRFALLGLRQAEEVLTAMEVSAAAELLQQLEKDRRDALMELLEPSLRREIGLIGTFDADEIGSRRSTNYIAIPDIATVKEAMSSLVRQAAEHDNISTLYLTDERGVFCGAIDLKDLILAREGTPLSAITTVSYPYVYARTAVEDCVPFLADHAETAVPVLDDGGRLIGVIAPQELVALLDDTLGDDYARLGGLSSGEDLSEPVGRSVRKRMPWLCILLGLGLGVSAVVGLFESTVARLPVILCFQSLVLDMAGNVGTQSLAVAIRVLTDARVGRRQRAALVWKEARVGLLNGLLLGALSFAVIGGYLCLSGNGAVFAFAVSGCLGMAMMAAMAVSALSGTLIPIFFRQVGVDPAVASGPLITTVNDLVAVAAYYGLARLLLPNALHLG